MGNFVLRRLKGKKGLVVGQLPGSYYQIFEVQYTWIPNPQIVLLSTIQNIFRAHF
jgi:hypothetical protein